MISILNGSKEFQAYDCETSYFVKPPRAGCRLVGVFFAAPPATLSRLYTPLALDCLSKIEPTITGYFCNEVATDRVILCCSVLRARKAWKGFSFIIILRLWRIFRVVTSKPRAKITCCRFLLPVLITETLGTVTTNSGYYEKRIFLSTFFELPFYSVSNEVSNI